MLTLNADSACDVCAEEYGPFNLPQSIPCGHVLCPVCANTIIQKSPPRQHPNCPFCREAFSPHDIRPIRIDFSQASGAGSSTGVNSELQNAMEQMALNDDETVLYDVRKGRSPNASARPSRATSRERASAASPQPAQGQNAKNIFTAIDEDRAHDPAYHRERAAELERKVAKVATKRTSPEEIHALHRELTDWISTAKHLPAVADTKEFSAIHLSNLLLRAIVANHASHAEALKVARGAESHLRACLQDGDLIREKLDSDLRKTKQTLAQKSQENAILKSELAKRGGASPDFLNFAPPGSAGSASTSNGGRPVTPGAVTPTRRQSMSAPTSPEGYFSFSSASTSIPLARNYPGSNPTSGSNSPCSSGRTTPTAGLALSGGMQPLTLPGGGGGAAGGAGVRSTASAAAAALPAPRASAPSATSISPARYAHARSASMIQRSATAAPTPLHRSQTPHTSSSTSSSSAAAARERRSMTPAPAAHRSASVTPARAETVKRAMTPGLTRSSASVAGAKDLSSPSSTTSNTPNASPGANTNTGNGSSAGAASLGGVSGAQGIPALPSLGVGVGMGSPLARPPVPPKPRTLSQSQQPSPPRPARHSLQGSGHRVVDDRDGYATEGGAGKKGLGLGNGSSNVGVGGNGGGGGEEKKKAHAHQRWLPSALLGMSRPATSHAVRGEM